MSEHIDFRRRFAHYLILYACNLGGYPKRPWAPNYYVIVNEAPDKNKLSLLNSRNDGGSFHDATRVVLGGITLRRAEALTISKVVKAEGEIIGHVAISPVTLSTGATGWFGLGPISILPQFQGLGIGSQLMQSALAALEEIDASGCVVLGGPAYYGRLGFKVIGGLVFPGVPAEYFQALSFSGEFPKRGRCLP
ncbi:GNAT family N-acetyltransferase [Gynuella sp.]|uniref:GNAT family N-acetyltransferase n=1 Tax=Gynuella sp. TaxID=2969146 RepID=UPI003D0F5E09